MCAYVCVNNDASQVLLATGKEELPVSPPVPPNDESSAPDVFSPSPSSKDGADASSPSGTGGGGGVEASGGVDEEGHDDKGVASADGAAGDVAPMGSLPYGQTDMGAEAASGSADVAVAAGAKDGASDESADSVEVTTANASEGETVAEPTEAAAPSDAAAEGDVQGGDGCADGTSTSDAAVSEQNVRRSMSSPEAQLEALDEFAEALSPTV